MLERLRRDGAVVLPDLWGGEIPQGGRKKPSLLFKTKLALDWPGCGAEFLPLVEAYYGRDPLWTEAELITTRPSTGAESGSQLWHRDVHDGPTLLRAIIYLCDVDMGNGPFCYRMRGGEERTFLGPRGTTIIADVAGEHRGLRCETGERRMLCFTYHLRP